jgi:hypothetical protein
MAGMGIDQPVDSPCGEIEGALRGYAAVCSDAAAPPASLPCSDSDGGDDERDDLLSVLTNQRRAALRLQLAENFQALVFHREVREAALHAGTRGHAFALHAYGCTAAKTVDQPSGQPTCAGLHRVRSPVRGSSSHRSHNRVEGVRIRGGFYGWLL